MASSTPPSTDSLLLEHLHRHPRAVAAILEQLLGEVEVGVRVVALADPLHRQAEDAGSSGGRGAAQAGALHAEDLGQGRAPHLELLGRGLAGADGALDLVAGPAQQPREGGVGWRSDQAKTSTATAALPGRRSPRRPARAGRRAARRRCPSAGRGQHRRHQVGAAAVVLLVGVGGVAVVLVGGDRLVLDAVVGGQVAAAQRQQRRGQADQRPPPPRGRDRARRSSGSRAAGGAAAPMAPSVRTSCIGSCASGSARLTSGITAIASASFTTPRRPGTPLGGAAAEGRACGPTRPRARRSRVRTAAAQWVGPCTSSPLRSAMPPSRSLSSGSSHQRLHYQLRVEAGRQAEVLDRDPLVGRVHERERPRTGPSRCGKKP